MNYSKIYDNIINNARSLNRNKGNGVYELHHIQMQSVGGTNDVSNLVLLTPKEHFVYLNARDGKRYKCDENSAKMRFAA